MEYTREYINDMLISIETMLTALGIPKEISDEIWDEFEEERIMKKNW